jgi:hypothetical protein
MNYFGHAVVSRQVGDSRHPDAVDSGHVGSAGYALGAMLPDFASMCGSRIDRADAPALAAGIDLHHRTDAVFHQLPAVVALMRELHQRLCHAGCGRGPARAVSHIGVELLLDGVLVEDAECRRLYLEAIDHSGAAVIWRDEHGRDRFATLQQRLRHYGVPDDLRRPGAVTERLLRILAPRPLLAPTASDASIIGAEIAAYQSRVVVAAATVLRGVYAGLALH